MDENETTPAHPQVSPAAGQGPVGSAPPVPPPGYPPTGGTPFAVPSVAPSTPPAKTRWRDVIFGWRSAVAVFAAGIVMGGLGGAALTVIVGQHGNGPTNSRFPRSGFAPGVGQYGGPAGSAGQAGQAQGQPDGVYGGQSGQDSQGDPGSTGFLGG